MSEFDVFNVILECASRMMDLRKTISYSLRGTKLVFFLTKRQQCCFSLIKTKEQFNRVNYKAERKGGGRGGGQL